MKKNNFITINILALVLAGCQPIPTPMPSVQNQLTGSTLSLDILEKNSSPLKLTVAQAGQYQLSMHNMAATAQIITFSSKVWFTLAPDERMSVSLDIPRSGLTFVSSLPGGNSVAMTGEITVQN